MTTVHVVWLSYHDDVRPRTQWDTACLRHMFDSGAPGPLHGWTFTHVDSVGEVPEGEGAVVVVPGQHHHEPEDVQRIHEEIVRLPWSVVMVIGDECSLFNTADLDGISDHLWVMTPRPDRFGDLAGSFTPLGEGWPSKTLDMLAELEALPDGLRARRTDVWFAGQITHDRRRELAAVLDQMGAPVVESPGFTQGLPRHVYLSRLLDTKVAPCPAGVCTQDSFRLYEALEAGCVPVVERASPKSDGPDPAYWPLLLGDEPPFPVVDSWGELPQVTERVLASWPAEANRAGSWWAQHQRRTAATLADQITDHTGRPDDAPTAAVTVLATTSPIGTHPDMSIIRRSVETTRRELPDAEIIILADGVPESLEHLRGVYEEYQERLLWAARWWDGVTVVRFDEHHHQAAMAKHALDTIVRTPLLLFWEHDWVFRDDRDVPWDALCAVLLADRGDVVRLSWEERIEPFHAASYDPPEDVDGVPMCRTEQWSSRPHLARTAYYRRILKTAAPSHTFVEDLMSGVVSHAHHQRGRHAWDEHRLWLYHPEGDISVIDHLDGRKGEPPVPSTYAYEGKPPPGAPRATDLRKPT